MHPELHRQKQRLDSLFGEPDNWPVDMEEAKAHWARYLCVLTSGFIENTVTLVLSEYARSTSHPNVRRFVSWYLRKRFSNPKAGPILDLVGTFSSEWRDSLQEVVPEEVWAAVDSVVLTRHAIAHGGSTGISLGVMRGYYPEVLRFAELLENTCR